MTSSLWLSFEKGDAGEASQLAGLTFAEVYTESFDASVKHLQVRFQMSYDAAEEIVQTAFLKQWERNPGLVGIENPYKYLRTCVIYDALDSLRTRQRHPLRSAAPLDQTVVGDSSMTLGDVWSLQHQGMSVEETVIVREQLRQAAEYLHRLPDIQQVLIQMHAAGYSYAEMRAYLSTHYGFQGSLKVIEHRLADSRTHLRQEARVQRQHHRAMRRKQSQKFPGWAAQYTACSVCGTTEIAHRAHGKCRHCYDKERMINVRKAAKLRNG